MADLPVTVMLKPNVDLDAAEAELAKAGFRVTDRLRSIGALNGSVDADALPKLSAIPGVLNVSESGVIHGPSPDADIQ